MAASSASVTRRRRITSPSMRAATPSTLWQPSSRSRNCSAPVLADDPDRRAEAGAVVVGVLGVLGDGGKHHAAVRQARAVGEAQRHAVDLVRDRRTSMANGAIAPTGAPDCERIKQGGQRKADDGVLGMASCCRAEAGAARRRSRPRLRCSVPGNGGRELRTDARSRRSAACHRRRRAHPVRATAPRRRLRFEPGAERQQRAMRKIPERRQPRDRFEVGLLPLALGLGRRQLAGKQPQQAAGRAVCAAKTPRCSSSSATT